MTLSHENPNIYESADDLLSNGVIPQAILESLIQLQVGPAAQIAKDGISLWWQQLLLQASKDHYRFGAATQAEIDTQQALVTARTQVLLAKLNR